MTIVAVLLILAVLFGGAGLLVEGLLWLLVIGFVLMVLGIAGAYRSRSGA
jgi:hypothetical protein